VFLFGHAVLIPVILAVFFYYKRHQWADDSFKERYGTFFVSHNPKDWGAVVAIRVLYFARRFALCYTLVFWQDFFWGQVALQYASSTSIIIIL